MESVPPKPARPMPTRAEFDEEGYLQLYPDIARGVADGVIESGWSHFSRAGYAEGRAWLTRPDPYVGVSREIAPGEAMYEGNPDHYFAAGESALHCIETALVLARRPRSTVRRILDLPCGHGRATRFLRRAFPDATIVACDLNRDGVDFCARAFGAIPVYSDPNPEAIPVPGPFDLIWCGSLFTHLTEPACVAFLRFFHRILDHRGLAVVTTHGRFFARELAAGRNRHDLRDAQIAELLQVYQQRGFAYVHYVDYPDYGFSLMHPTHALQLVDQPDWRVLGYAESAWDGRQDVLTLQKSLGGVALGI